MTTAMAQSTQAAPDTYGWIEEFRETYLSASAHAFILTGDVYGLTVGGQRPQLTLELLLYKSKEIVIRYNRARGFSFLKDSMRPKAAKLVESSTGSHSEAGMRSAMARAINETIGPNNLTGGNDPFVEDTANPQRIPNALRLIEKLLLNPDARKRVAVFVEQAELICPDMDRKGVMSAVDRETLGILSSWGRDIELQKTDNPIFLISGKLNELHADLRSSNSGVKVIDIPLPDRADRLAYLTRYLGARDEAQKPIPLLELTIEELANATAGVNLRQIEDILMLAYKATPSGVTRQLVKTRKDQIITSEYSEIAEMIDPLEGGFAALGGMEHLISWARVDVIDPLRKNSPEVPKGVLLVGPPGTGKTYFIRALAQEVGFNAVMLKSENILSKYVGESEEKLKRFFKFVAMMSPCLVFFDELDQSDMSSRGGDNHPVARNLFGQMLQFMSDETNRGKVICFFASNRPDKIDSALLRFGRMDAIIPVLLPDEPARAGIVKAQAKGQNIEITPQAVDTAAERSGDYSAADLAAIVSKAKKLARRAERPVINEQDIARAMALIQPATPQIAREYTLLAIQACNDAELLPPEYAALLGDRPGLAAQIKVAAEEYVPPSREDRSL